MLVLVLELVLVLVLLLELLLVVLVLASARYAGPPMEAVHAVVVATGAPTPRFPAGSDYGIEPDVDVAVLAEIEREEAAAAAAGVPYECPMSAL